MWENFVSTRLRCASFFSPALLGLPSHQQRCLSVRVPGEKKRLQLEYALTSARFLTSSCVRWSSAISYEHHT